MVPNRFFLLTTTTEAPGGVEALLATARHSLQNVPWPLCGDLFRVTPDGVELLELSGVNGE
jgi:hypothetical protein